MKKNLIALGAMLAAIFTLTNCTEEIQTTPQEEGTPYTIIANAADTKTVNDDMNTAWADEDAISVFHAPEGTATYSGNSKFIISNVESGIFTTEALKGTPGESNDWYAIYPYVQYVETPANVSKGYTPVGSASNAAQTQTGNNSMAHIAGPNYPMWGIDKAVAKDAVPEITMTHLSSLIEVVVTNGTEEELVVSTVSLTAGEDIVGTYYIDFSTANPVFTPSGTSYVSKVAKLNVTNGAAIPAGEKANFYLAIKPFTAAAESNLILAVNGVEKTKKLTAATTFAPGHLTALNFTLDKVVVGPEPVDLADGAYWIIAGGKVATAEAPNGYLLVEDAVNGKSTAVNAFTFTKVSDGKYTIQDSNSKYLYQASSNKILTASAAPDGGFTDDYYWSVSTQNEVHIIKNVGQNKYFQYSTNYNSYGSYATEQSGGVLPVLVAATDPITPTALATPASLTAGDIKYNSLMLTWTAVENAVEYEVSYRKTAETEATPVATTVTAATATVSGLEAETDYTFFVKAIAGASAWLDSEAATTTATTIKKPEGALEDIVLTADWATNLANLPNNQGSVTDYTMNIGGYSYKVVAEKANYQSSAIFFGKADAYIELPAIEGYSLTKVVITSGSNCSTSVKVAIKDIQGNVVSGGEDKTLSTTKTGYEYNLSGTSSNTAYRITVTNSKNCQLSKWVLAYTPAN